MKLVTQSPHGHYKLIRRVFPYRGGFRWIITDERTQGYGSVLAHGMKPKYMEARAEAREKVKELER